MEHAPGTGRRSWRSVLATFLPMAVVTVLCLPCLRLEYFWDDFYFLTVGGAGNPFTYLLPQLDQVFYRPIPQGLYFLALRALGPAGIVGHLANLLLLAVAVLLLTRLVARIGGERAGVLAGLFFAVSGCVPGLVAWVSAVQDLLAILFTLAAFLLREERRDVPALLAMLAAVLSKETAVVAVPVFLFWDFVAGREARRFRFHAIGCALLASLWVVLHPGLWALGAHGFRSGKGGYVGIEHSELWAPYGMRYLLTLINVPPLEFAAGWERTRALCGAIAAALLAVASRLMPSRADVGERRISKRAFLFVGLFVMALILAPTIAVRIWAPYYACFAVAMLAVLIGPALARLRAPQAVLLLVVLLVLGVRYRTARPGAERSWTEMVFVDASSSIRNVRVQFAQLFPFLPRGAYVPMSVGSTGVRGIQSSMIDGQTLQVWYRDPTLRTVPILEWRRHAGPEFLVRITPELEVVSIDPGRGETRTATDHAPDKSEVTKPIVAYARARAAAGDVDEAVAILRSLAEQDKSPDDRAYYGRMTASFLIRAGRYGEADSILTNAPRFSREFSLRLVKRLLAEPTRDEQADLSAFPAFGLSEHDPETLRWMMREFARSGALGQAAWLARRVLELDPLDRESASVVRSAEEKGIQPNRFPG